MGMNIQGSNATAFQTMNFNNNATTQTPAAQESDETKLSDIKNIDDLKKCDDSAPESDAVSTKPTDDNQTTNSLDTTPLPSYTQGELVILNAESTNINSAQFTTALIDNFNQIDSQKMGSISDSEIAAFADRWFYSLFSSKM